VTGNSSRQPCDVRLTLQSSGKKSSTPGCRTQAPFKRLLLFVPTVFPILVLTEKVDVLIGMVTLLDVMVVAAQYDQVCP